MLVAYRHLWYSSGWHSKNLQNKRYVRWFDWRATQLWSHFLDISYQLFHGWLHLLQKLFIVPITVSLSILENNSSLLWNSRECLYLLLSQSQISIVLINKLTHHEASTLWLGFITHWSSASTSRTAIHWHENNFRREKSKPASSYHCHFLTDWRLVHQDKVVSPDACSPMSSFFSHIDLCYV